MKNIYLKQMILIAAIASLTACKKTEDPTPVKHKVSVSPLSKPDSTIQLNK